MILFDIVIVLFIGLLTVFGFWKDLFKQVIMLAGVVGGYLRATGLYEQASKFFYKIGPSSAELISFRAIFVAFIVAAALAG
ncbi:MAG TPA: CvpA family protein [Syntrophorhabdus sp.]|jgi:uncharacterized membrane protein required for colicin V production|nr:CvpA family protein [Syntrophorhabdus sp.]HQM27071.1 CvpA family protein [Syntrophorhabdus sp.]